MKYTRERTRITAGKLAQRFDSVTNTQAALATVLEKTNMAEHTTPSTEKDRRI